MKRKGNLNIPKYFIFIVIFLFLFTILFSFDNIRTLLIKYPFKSILYKLSTKRDETIYNKIKNFLPPPPSRLLNLGCGLNTLSDRLQSLNYNISCVDINDISISKKNIFVYDGKNLPQCNYDACILSTVLHHIPIEEHDRIIKMISKCCKRLIIVEDDNDYQN
jgi:2-polyprenyl-3-methyl-5-hydroxy-6-metoxy-1,4-benzoquinol methylase